MGHTVHAPSPANEYVPAMQDIGIPETVGHSEPAGQVVHDV